MKLIYLFLVLLLFGFFACDESDKYEDAATYEKMIGTWYLIDRGPDIDSSITACEKREYLVFRDNSTSMRHQDCLPKSDTEGRWEIVNGKCMMRMYITFQGLVVSDSTQQIEFELIASDKVKVQKRFPIFLAWGIYQKIQE